MRVSIVPRAMLYAARCHYQCYQTSSNQYKHLSPFIGPYKPYRTGSFTYEPLLVVIKLIPLHGPLAALSGR